MTFQKNITGKKYRIPIYLCWALFHMRRPVEAAIAAYRAEETVARHTIANLLSGKKLMEIQAEPIVLKIGVAIASNNVERAKILCIKFLELAVAAKAFIMRAVFILLSANLIRCPTYWTPQIPVCIGDIPQ